MPPPPAPPRAEAKPTSVPTTWKAAPPGQTYEKATPKRRPGSRPSSVGSARSNYAVAGDVSHDRSMGRATTVVHAELPGSSINSPSGVNFEAGGRAVDQEPIRPPYEIGSSNQIDRDPALRDWLCGGPCLIHMGSMRLRYRSAPQTTDSHSVHWNISIEDNLYTRGTVDFPLV